MDGIDLNDVATFIRIADKGSFTAAAAAAGVPKSTVSRSLGRLERALGVRLLHRTTNSLALTDAGRVYYDRVRGAVRAVTQATADVVDLGKEPRGLIRVTAPVDVAETFLADVIARFVKRYPEVRFEVALTSRTVDLVGEGFDLAVRASRLRDSSLVARKLPWDAMGLFASPAYLKQRGTPKTPADLAAHEVIRFRPIRGAVVLETEGQKERVTLSGGIEADELLFIRGLVLAGAGIGLLPFFVASRAATPERDGFVRVLPAWRLRGGALSVVAPSARHEPRRVKLFRDFLVAESKRLALDAT